MYHLHHRTTFGFSAENPTGARNGGTPGKDCEKLRPCISIKSGETITLCDVDGPGMITHIWFTGYIGHGFILRIYWDGMEAPSVEAPLSAFFGCAYDENMEDMDGRYPVLNSALLLRPDAASTATSRCPSVPTAASPWKTAVIIPAICST